MGGAIEVVAIALAAGSLFAVIAVGIIAGITGFAIAAPAFDSTDNAGDTFTGRL